jgi:hypothetical protein
MGSPWQTEIDAIGDVLKKPSDATAAPPPGQPDYQSEITKSLDPNTVVDPNTGRPIPGPPGNPVTDFGYGLSKPFDTAGNLLARGIAAVAPEGSGVQQWAQGQEQELQKHADAYAAAYGGKPPIYSPQRDLGEGIPMAALSMALPGSTGSFVPRLISNAVGGALSGVLTGDPNASASDLGKEALQGGMLGAAAAPLTGVAARVAYPAMARPGTDVSRLMDIGVRPTLGQAAGGAINRLEQTATSIPIIGDFIKSARQRSVYQFNMGLMNDALAPLGQTLDATQPGREAIQEMAARISGAYQRAVPQAGGTLDQQATQDLAQLRTNAQMLAPGREQQFNAMLDQYVQRHIDPATGMMTGQGFKDAESDLGKEASNYLYNRNATSDERVLGQQLRNAQTVLRDWLERVNPQASGDLQAANAAYAKQLRIENAAARPGAEPGVFSPAQFQAAVKSYAPQGQVARGTALSEPLADAGRAILGPTVPDSGTPLRHAVQFGVGALLGEGAGLDIPLEAKIAALAGVGGAGALYNPLSQRLVAHIIASRYPWMENVATGARALSPLAAGAAPPGLLHTNP